MKLLSTGKPDDLPDVSILYPGTTVFAILESMNFGQREVTGRWAPTIEGATMPQQGLSSLDREKYRLLRVGPEHARGHRLVRAVPIVRRRTA